MTPRATPRISVIVPTYNRLERLRRVLEALREQTMPVDQFEVIVVSDGSSDGTDDWLASGAAPLPVIVATQPNQGPAAARNRGVERSNAELLLFLDDDVIPLSSLIQEHLEGHHRHGPDVVILGPMLTPPDHRLQPWVRYEQDMLYKQYAAMIQGLWEPTARQFYTGNASVERRHVMEAGGFDTRFSRAEDVELAYRLAARGVRFVFAPAAAGNHYAERDFRSWQRTAYQYGRNDVIFHRDKGQTWLLPTIAREFNDHHPLLRSTVRVFVDRPILRGLTVAGFAATARVAARLGADRVGRAALSAVYNLTYYRGIRDELGSLEAVLRPAAAAA